MPAEIDTGGPRVLHCDYRADCPIPIVASASTKSFLRRENRVVRASILRRLPRTDENESPDDRLVQSCRWSGLSSRRIGLRGFRRADLSTALSVPRNVDVLQTLRYKDFERNVFCPEQLESRLCDTSDDFEGNATINQGQSKYRSSLERREAFRKFQRVTHFSSSRGNLTGHDCHAEQSCFSKHDFSTETWTLYQHVDNARIEEALFSSQSSDSSREDRNYEKLVSTSTPPSLVEETWEEVDTTNSWRCESRITKVELTDRQTEFPRFDESLRSSRRTRKKRRECPNNRSSYFQLAFLLFLVAFGQCGLRKSGVLNCSAKSSTTGLSVLAIGTVISAVSAAPVDLMSDAGVRAERSANLSHITGASRKIQMYIKNRHLQILPDGTVNGSNDDTSDYTIFQRTSVSRGQLRIQGVATCLYLCMDSCGLLYGSREYTDDCVFNETLEQHNYNTYSSAKWSTAKKTLYLGLNRRGQPRRVQAKGHNLGRLSAYARVLTQVAPSERVEALQRRMLGAQHNVRHRHNSHRGDLIQQSLCPTLPVQEKDGRDKFRCRKRKKRKKRKRKCRSGEKPGPQCQIVEDSSMTAAPLPKNEGLRLNGTSPESKRSCEDAASEEACRREALSVPSKKRKLRVEEPTKSTADGRNVTANNGKSKTPASNAKKINAAESMSQSKKPNLTDGKKKKKKGPAARRNPAASPGRKKFTPGRTSNTSAVPTATSVPIYVTSSSSWWSSGTSIAPSGKGTSPKRKTKPASKPKAEFGGSNDRAVSPRRIGKTFARNRTKTINRVAVTTVYEATTNLDQSSQSVTTKVPELFSDRFLRTSSPSSAENVEDVSRSLSESLFIDEDSSSTVSSELATTTIDSILATSIEATGTPTTFRLFEDETRSTEEVDDIDENDRFDTSESIQLTTPEVSLERLAM
ncbi:uncharacterized protein LOC143182661 [Calliopsis andreniformis]|uniref:uncharacterized protein LOC143182661 n=1 Tax=Calliopsis andreniformis TaxID=337506 RepID=UPI003FCCD323